MLHSRSLCTLYFFVYLWTIFLASMPKFGHHISAKYENFTDHVCLNVGVKKFWACMAKLQRCNEFKPYIMYFKVQSNKDHNLAKDSWKECESILLAYPSVHAVVHISVCEPFQYNVRCVPTRSYVPLLLLAMCYIISCHKT